LAAWIFLSLVKYQDSWDQRDQLALKLFSSIARNYLLQSWWGLLNTWLCGLPPLPVSPPKETRRVTSALGAVISVSLQAQLEKRVFATSWGTL